MAQDLLSIFEYFPAEIGKHLWGGSGSEFVRVLAPVRCLNLPEQPLE